jgi:hypothetical protein
MARRVINWSCKDRQANAQDVRDLIGASHADLDSGAVLGIVCKGVSGPARRTADQFNAGGKGRVEFIGGDEP